MRIAVPPRGPCERGLQTALFALVVAAGACGDTPVASSDAAADALADASDLRDGASRGDGGPTDGATPNPDSGGEPTDDNPSGYPLATEVYAARDYEAGVPATDQVDPGDADHAMNHEPGGSFDGSGVYGLQFLTVQLRTTGGWNGAWGGHTWDGPDVSSNSLFASHVIKISQKFADHIADPSVNHVAKFWDGYIYQPDGGTNDDTGRWVVKLGNLGSGPSDTFSASLVQADPNLPIAAMWFDNQGGAGLDYGLQGSWMDWSEFPYSNAAGGGPDVDGLFKLEDHADQWIWFCYVFDADAGYIRYYFKTQTGPYSDRVYQVLERPLVISDLGLANLYGEPIDMPNGTDYDTPTRGWVDMDFGNFWGEVDAEMIDGASHFWQDRVRIANGWIPPPF